MLLACPGVLVACTVYCLLLWEVPDRGRSNPSWIVPLSRVVLDVIALELILVETLGPVRVRSVVGPPFVALHIALVMTTPPALANLLLLGRRSPVRLHWGVSAIICTIVGYIQVVHVWDIGG